MLPKFIPNSSIQSCALKFVLKRGLELRRRMSMKRKYCTYCFIFRKLSEFIWLRTDSEDPLPVMPTILCNQDRSACREFWAPFWCVASERKCGNWCSSVLFSCRPDTTKPCVTSESNNSYLSSNKKTSLAQLFVAMSCDEKNNKRRKKRSKQSSETNSHVVPNSCENREVSSGK